MRDPYIISAESRFLVRVDYLKKSLVKNWISLFSSDLLPYRVCSRTESKIEKKFLVPVEKKIEKTEERSKSALPAPEEILLVRQRSSFFNDDQNGVNWNNDSLVSP